MLAPTRWLSKLRDRERLYLITQNYEKQEAKYRKIKSFKTAPLTFMTLHIKRRWDSGGNE